MSRNIANRSRAAATGRDRGDHALLVRTILTVAALILLVMFPWRPATPAGAQSGDAFPMLVVGRRVYDETTTPLTPEQIAALERQLAVLQADGADTILYVRALPATPGETLDQVQALQQAWVALSGVDQDHAVAILINRNPDDPNDARAGIFVGSTFDDGNVPSDEQRAIIDDALIPPLRNGDVYGSLTAGLTRLDDSIRNGPPQSSFEKWASSAADSWLPWTGLGLAIAGLAAALALFRNRETTTFAAQQPSTLRPTDLTPALAGALATGSPQASAVPATLLDLAARNAIDIEPESEGGFMSQAKIQIRLVDRRPVRDDVEATVWTDLERRAEDGVVSSKDVAKLAADSQKVRDVVKRQMGAEGWLVEGAGAAKAGLIVIVAVATGLAVFATVVAATAGEWLLLVAIVPLVLAALIALGFYVSYSGLSRRGQEAAIPWQAYREGLNAAAKDDSIPLDLDAVLPDTVAMNLGAAMDDRLKRATAAGLGFRAFMSSTGPRQGTAYVGYFPYWVAFSSTAATSSGSSSGTVSGGSAGGGCGAAGST